MKIRYIQVVLFLIVFLSLTTIGCLKDTAFNNGEIQSGSGSNSSIKVVSVALTTSSTDNFLVAAYDNSDNDTTVNLIPIELGGASAATEDVHVTLTADSTLVTDYNAANTDTTVTDDNPEPTGDVTHYDIPKKFTVLNGGVVTIPKGQRTGYLQISFKPSDFLGGSYAVGYKITAVTESGYTISGNLSTGIVVIGIKNAYEATYKVTGWFFHPSSGRAINTTKKLSTLSAIGLQGGVGDLGTPFQFDVVNNSLTNWSSDGFVSSAFMTADDPGNTDYSSATNQGHVPGDAVFNSTIYNNTYDPNTQTFYMHYGYCNSCSIGGGDQNGFTRQVYEKWVRVN